MNTLKTILFVSRFESKMLLRSWAFRIICFMTMGLVTLQTIGILSLIYFVSGEFNLGPFFSSTNNAMLALMQVGQMLSMFMVFFANDIGNRDKRIGVDNIIGSRPLTETQYVIGRMLGLLFPLIIMMIGVLVAIIGIQQAFGFQGVSPSQYIPFFFFYNILTVSFSIALTAFFSTILKNRLLTSLATLLAILGTAFFGAQYSQYFDMSAFQITGNYSALIGYGPLAPLIQHRVLYLTITIFLITATVFTYPRPEAVRRGTLSKITLACTAAAAVLFIAFTYLGEFRTKANKEAWADALRDATENKAASVTHYDMDIAINTGGDALQGNVKTELVNRDSSAQDSFIFVLNPGLRITSLTENDSAVPYTRTGPLVELTLSSPLPPGESRDLSWQYQGSIDPVAAFLTPLPPIENFTDGNMRQMQFMLGSQSGWIGSQFSFMLPESHWYPIPNSTFGHTYPDKRPKNFATAKIQLTLPDDWIGTTQGVLTSEEKSGNTMVQIFNADVPVPKFSLHAGEYKKATTEIRGIQCSFLYAPVHAENVDLFADAAEELERTIDEVLENIENKTNLKYPYKALTLVETPGTCRTFSDTWDGRNLLVQPGTILLTESNFFKVYFKQSIERSTKSTKSEGTGATNEQIKMKLLHTYFVNNSFGGDLEINLLPHFWEFQIDTSGDAFPALDTAFTASLSQRATERHQEHPMVAMAGLNQPRGTMYIEGTKVDLSTQGGPQPFMVMAPTGKNRELLKIPLASMTPDSEGNEFVPLMNRKTQGFLETLEMAMGEDNWVDFIPYLLESYRFKTITLEDFKKEAIDYTDADVSWIFDQYLTESIMPGYQIAKAEAYEIDDGQRERLFQTVTRIDNLEDGKGFVTLRFDFDSKKEEDRVEKEVFLEGGESKVIKMVLLDKPKRITVLSPYTRNVHRLTETLLIPEEVKKEAGEDSVLSVDSKPKGLEILVDDLDPGFSIGRTDGEGRARLGDSKKDEETEFPGYNGWGSPREWQEQITTSAHGKYEKTRKIKRAGDGNEYAKWEAQIPKTGSWEIFYYLDYSYRDSYRLLITTGNSERELELDLKDSKEGWQSLGKFDFQENDSSSVTVFDKMKNTRWGSRIYADAVKWVHEDSQETSL